MTHVTRYGHILLLAASVAAFAVALRSPLFVVGACTGVGLDRAQPVVDTILRLVEAGPFPNPDAETLWRAWPAFPLLFTSWWAVAFRRRVVAGGLAICSLAWALWFFPAEQILCAQGGDEPGPFFYAAVRDYGSGYLLLLLAAVMGVCSSVICEEL